MTVNSEFSRMFGYNLAAAHLGLKHTIAHSFQVSDVWTGGEGWKLIDEVPVERICKNFPKSEYPHGIHYCQHYYLAKFYISKYMLRKDFISCEAPLLTVPPRDLATRYSTAIPPPGSRTGKGIKEWKPKQAKYNAFMVCAIIGALNDAAIYYKNNHCKEGTGNYNYSYSFHKDMIMPDRGTDNASNATTIAADNKNHFNGNKE